MQLRGDPKTFRDNLKRLTVMRGLSGKEAAQQITESQMVTISEKWYRKLCNKGLAQVKGSSGERLQAIARFFGLPTMSHLWRDDLIIFSLTKDAVPPIESEFTVKLVELLETGEHDYLRGLIANLHACHFRDKESPIFGRGKSESDGEMIVEEEIRHEDEDGGENDEDWR